MFVSVPISGGITLILLKFRSSFTRDFAMHISVIYKIIKT